MAQSKLSQIFSYNNWVHAVSGATGGVLAMSVFYPLDTVRSRLQVENSDQWKDLHTLRIIQKLIQQEGFATLYRGLVPVLQSLCISNFVYFYAFHCLKTMNERAQQSALRDLILGSIAGIINVLTTTPFWVVNTRLKMRGVAGPASDVVKHYSSLVEGLKYVAKNEGIPGLWSGTIPSLMLVINPALQFMMYELLKRRLTTIYGELNSTLSYFIIGAVAKAFATVVTYPLQLVQTKQRHRSHNDDFDKNAGTIQMMLTIIRTQGAKGLFRGLEAKILQTVLTAALMFATYEKVAKGVGTLLAKTPKS